MFWHRQRDTEALVHGDDFVSCGERTELECLCKSTKKKFETKMTMVGEDDNLAKEARVQNRIVRWHPRTGITDEAHPRHAEIICRDARPEKLKTISKPAATETGRESEEEKRRDLSGRRLSGKLGDKIDGDNDGDMLSPGEVTRYRRIPAGANLLAQDRMDIVFAAK